MLLTFKYDSQNRIVERYFKDPENWIRDSIVYLPSNMACSVYSYSNDDEKNRTTHYVYGKNRSEGKLLKETYASGEEPNEDAYNYLLKNGLVILTTGHAWNGSWNGGPNSMSYVYNGRNLTHFFLDTEAQHIEYIEALKSWEKAIYDEKIEYNKSKGIFSGVNNQSYWLLMAPFGEFLPTLHLGENVSKISPFSEGLVFKRDFEKCPAVLVDYKYKLNKEGYPREMVLKVNSKEENLNFARSYSINYQERSEYIPSQIPEVRKPSSKKRLPISLKTPQSEYQYTYDNERRFTSITKIVDNEIVSADTLIYTPNSFKRYSLINNVDSSSNKGMEISFVRDDNKILFDSDDSEIEYTFNETGTLNTIIIKPNDYDPDTSIDPPIIIGYIYDANNNLVDMYLPNSASGDRVNRILQMYEYSTMKYDNMNGIFKHVNKLACFMSLYDLGEELPLYYFIGNNIISMGEGNEIHPNNFFELKYVYDDYDYPISVSKIQVKYQDAE